jgi:hypothetical protein
MILHLQYVARSIDRSIDLHCGVSCMLQCLQVPCCATNLGKQDWFVAFIMQSFLHKKGTFDCAIGILEELLGARQKLFELQHVGMRSHVPPTVMRVVFLSVSIVRRVAENFAQIVEHLRPPQLSTFCRVLAFVAFDIESDLVLDKQENQGKQSASPMKLIRQQVVKAPTQPTLLDKNHGTSVHQATNNIRDALRTLMSAFGATRANHCSAGSIEQPCFAAEIHRAIACRLYVVPLAPLCESMCAALY